MQENENNWWMWILIGVTFWALFLHKQKYEDMTAEEWFNEYDEVQSQLESTKEALDQANSNIEEAKYYAWESYDDMGYTLDSLETVEP